MTMVKRGIQSIQVTVKKPGLYFEDIHDKKAEIALSKLSELKNQESQ